MAPGVLEEGELEEGELEGELLSLSRQVSEETEGEVAGVEVVGPLHTPQAFGNGVCEDAVGSPWLCGPGQWPVPPARFFQGPVVFRPDYPERFEVSINGRPGRREKSVEDPRVTEEREKEQLFASIRDLIRYTTVQDAMRSMDAVCSDLKTAIKKIDKLFRLTKSSKKETIDSCSDIVAFSKRVLEGLRSIHIVAGASGTSARNVDTARQLFRSAWLYRHDVFTADHKSELERLIRGSKTLKVVLEDPEKPKAVVKKVEGGDLPVAAEHTEGGVLSEAVPSTAPSPPEPTKSEEAPAAPDSSGQPSEASTSGVIDIHATDWVTAVFAAMSKSQSLVPEDESEPEEVLPPPPPPPLSPPPLPPPDEAPSEPLFLPDPYAVASPAVSDMPGLPSTSMPTWNRAPAPTDRAARFKFNIVVQSTAADMHKSSQGEGVPNAATAAAALAQDDAVCYPSVAGAPGASQWQAGPSGRCVPGMPLDTGPGIPQQSGKRPIPVAAEVFADDFGSSKRPRTESVPDSDDDMGPHYTHTDGRGWDAMGELSASYHSASVPLSASVVSVPAAFISHPVVTSAPPRASSPVLSMVQESRVLEPALFSTSLSTAFEPLSNLPAPVTANGHAIAPFQPAPGAVVCDAARPLPVLDCSGSAVGEDVLNLLRRGKLCLVLDLDHTLLNSARFQEVDPQHEAILRQRLVVEQRQHEATVAAAAASGSAASVVSQQELFRLDALGMWTKLRPGVYEFLRRAAELCELWIHTNGNAAYANAMVGLLDPKGDLFGSRVIAQGSAGQDEAAAAQSKRLMQGLEGREPIVTILDDSSAVWPHDRRNLVVVERYVYFACSRRRFGMDGKSLLESNRDECPRRGMLMTALGVLERLHTASFRYWRNPSLAPAAPLPGTSRDPSSSEPQSPWDMRNVISEQRRRVLAGVHIVFSRVIPLEQDPRSHPLWRLAEQCGAVCSTQVSEQTTHVVAATRGTEKTFWAAQNGRFVVMPAWLECSCVLWKRAPEDRYATPL